MPVVKADMLALMKPVTGKPMVLGPKQPAPTQRLPMLPLFSQEQMKQVEEMDQAPMISGARALRDEPASSAREACLALGRTRSRHQK